MNWALVDVSCIECSCGGEDTVVVSLHETEEQAQYALKEERERLGLDTWSEGYFNGGQHELHVCPVGRE